MTCISGLLSHASCKISTLYVIYSFVLFGIASQCWALGRFLPLIIADLVPADDPLWECFLHLHEILAICMSPAISPMTISYLAQLIQIHHRLYKECYPTMNVTPKMHYMVHLPEQIRRYMCMCFNDMIAYSIIIHY